MPAHKPSPHRFLAPPPSSNQKPKSKPQSSLRHGFTAQTPKQSHSSVPEAQKVTPAKRFVITPARNASSGDKEKQKASEDEAWLKNEYVQSTPRLKAGRKLQRVESIDEGSQESPSMSRHQGVIAQSIEGTHSLADDQQGDDNEDPDADMLFAFENRNKRRRISPELPSSPSQLAERILQPPQTPAPATAAGASSHRFLAPAPRTPAPFSHTSNTPTTTSTTPAPSRPHFKLPPVPTSPAKPTTPLPETFSPSRKGQKYMPGGLASTLQSWIIETANTGYTAQTRDTVVWGRDKEDGVKMRVRISEAYSGRVALEKDEASEGVECFTGGVVFVRGDMETGLYNASRVPGEGRGGDVKVLLAGQGGTRSAGGVRIREGGVVGMRAPVWDVDVGGEKWMVDVDWVVL